MNCLISLQDCCMLFKSQPDVLFYVTQNRFYRLFLFHGTIDQHMTMISIISMINNAKGALQGQKRSVSAFFTRHFNT